MLLINERQSCLRKECCKKKKRKQKNHNKDEERVGARSFCAILNNGASYIFIYLRWMVGQVLSLGNDQDALMMATVGSCRRVELGARPRSPRVWDGALVWRHATCDVPKSAAATPEGTQCIRNNTHIHIYLYTHICMYKYTSKGMLFFFFFFAPPPTPAHI